MITKRDRNQNRAFSNSQVILSLICFMLVTGCGFPSQEQYANTKKSTQNYTPPNNSDNSGTNPNGTGQNTSGATGGTPQNSARCTFTAPRSGATIRGVTQLALSVPTTRPLSYVTYSMGNGSIFYNFAVAVAEDSPFTAEFDSNLFQNGKWVLSVAAMDNNGDDFPNLCSIFVNVQN